MIRDLPPASSMTSCGGEAHGVERLEVGPQLVEVPVVAVALGGGLVDEGVDGVFQEELDLLVQVVAFEDAAAVAVDGFALAVQDVVVLQDVLALFGVAAFHLALGRGDGARDELGFERDVVRAPSCSSAVRPRRS